MPAGSEHTKSSVGLHAQASQLLSKPLSREQQQSKAALRMQQQHQLPCCNAATCAGIHCSTSHAP
jgi:hypothetical protein